MIYRFFITAVVTILFPIRLIWTIIAYLRKFEIKIKIFSFKTFLVLTLVAVSYVFSIFYFSILTEIPSSESLSRYDPNLTTKIYDRKGNLLYKLYFNEDRTLVELENIPEVIINATLAIEDEKFFEHKGLSYKGIARAIKRTFFEDDLEGGSTITQQVVKNLLLSPERTYERKIKEALIAIEVERKYSKEEILELYLNSISYGGTAYGIKAASRKYFGKELEELTLSESAYLSGLPGAPSRYSPYSNSPEMGKLRQQDVLNRMASAGYISKEEAENAINETLSFNDKTESIKYPHFVNYVIDHLQKEYGHRILTKAGLEVYTSIDPELQDQAEKIVSRDVSTLKRYNARNGSALITNPKTGEILAMVGSVNYWDVTNDGNVNITTSARQPGSSIKPLTYAIAFESGEYKYNSRIIDAPVSYNIPGQPAYKPVNYDGRFHGTMTLKSALANSYNIPAVKLADDLGVSTIIDWGKKMGITTWNEPERYGLSLTLGAGEVKMVDMAVLYGAFANLGYKQPLNPILKIYDNYGNTIKENSCVNFIDENPSVLTRKEWLEFRVNAFRNINSYSPKFESPQCRGERVISEKTAYYISNILSDNRARVPAFGARSNLHIDDIQVAVKTGTTQNTKDNWAVGYTDDYVVVTWIGNNNGDPMKNVSSGYASASLIWRNLVDYLIDNKNIKESLSKPSNLVEVKVCALTGSLACAECPTITTELFVSGDEPKRACTSDEIKRILQRQEEDREREDRDNRE